MSYIGNPIVSTDFPVDYASGNGSTTAFTLSVAPASVNSIDVQISGVSQSPQTYSVSGTTLTFSAAPPTGTNNIVVRHLGVAGVPNVPATGSVVPSSIGTGYSLWNLSGADVNYTAGNVGIGVTSPAAKLDVSNSNGRNARIGGLQISGTSSTADAGNNFVYGGAYWNGTNYTATATTAAGVQLGNGALLFRTDSGLTAGNTFTATERMRIDSSGNVGIGTSSPNNKLVVSNNGAAGIEFGPVNGDIFTYNRSTLAYTDLQLTANQLLFRTNGSNERMRIDTSGNLLVGTTNSSLTAGIGIKINYSSTVPYICTTGSDTTNSNSAYYLYSTGASAYRFYVGYGGTISATSATITSLSDQRLKENIIDLPDGLDAVMALKPRKFDWKEGKGKDIKGDRGFIAQEFETVFPDMIEEWKDTPPEGENPYKGVNANLIPTLVKAIQELNAKVEAQALEIKALKGTV